MTPQPEVARSSATGGGEWVQDSEQGVGGEKAGRAGGKESRQGPARRCWAWQGQGAGQDAAEAASPLAEIKFFSVRL